MAEKPTCSCGSNEPKRFIFPCAGQANVGQLTNLAALQLTEEGYGTIVCMALLATGAEILIRNAKNADEVVVLDGCPMHCAAKIVASKDIAMGQHIVVTELGIAKGPSKNYTNDDVETVVAACWKGEGRKPGSGKPGNPEKGSGCGCGCGGSC